MCALGRHAGAAGGCSLNGVCALQRAWWCPCRVPLQGAAVRMARALWSEHADVIAEYCFIMLLSEWRVRFQAGMLARLHGTASWCRCKWRAHFGAGMLVPLQGAA